MFLQQYESTISVLEDLTQVNVVAYLVPLVLIICSRCAHNPTCRFLTFDCYLLKAWHFLKLTHQIGIVKAVAVYSF